MREESYCQAQLQKQLTAYTIRPYHLSSPNFREMIRLRIDFATRHAASEKGRQGSPDRYYQELLDFFEVLRRSVFDKNRNIARLIEATSFGNMRLALDLFNNFITSGATYTQEILERFRASGTYSVPFHQFAKSVILGDYRFYKQSRSLVTNVFDISEARNSSHFTALRILRFLGGGFGARRTTEGFLDLQDLVNAMVDVFDNEEDSLREADGAWEAVGRTRHTALRDNGRCILDSSHERWTILPSLSLQIFCLPRLGVERHPDRLCSPRRAACPTYAGNRHAAAFRAS